MVWSARSSGWWWLLAACCEAEISQGAIAVAMPTVCPSAVPSSASQLPTTSPSRVLQVVVVSDDVDKQVLTDDPIAYVDYGGLTEVRADLVSLVEKCEFIIDAPNGAQILDTENSFPYDADVDIINGWWNLTIEIYEAGPTLVEIYTMSYKVIRTFPTSVPTLTPPSGLPTSALLIFES